MLRRLTPIVLVALACTGVAAAKTPVLRHAKPVRMPALSGVQTSQWKTWWGAPSFDAKGVTLSSQAPVSPDETHSALITTKRTWQDSTISFATTTLRQLREGSAPNPWEVGWVMFRFQDPANYYWFMLKTNGFELGKKQGSDTQIFLVTGALPALTIGQSRRIQVRAQGARIQIFVDGSRLVDFTDPHPLLGPGSVGLYEEDSQVRFDSLTVI